jgi:hypothetical protein
MYCAVTLSPSYMPHLIKDHTSYKLRPLSPKSNPLIRPSHQRPPLISGPSPKTTPLIRLDFTEIVKYYVIVHKKAIFSLQKRCPYKNGTTVYMQNV